MTPDHDLALCIHAYYVGELDAGRRACERLLSRGDLPEETDRMVRTNRLWYTSTLSRPTTAGRCSTRRSWLTTAG